MFCKKCGAPIKDGAKFCQKCGEPVVVNGNPVTGGKKRISPAVIIGIIAAAVVVIVAVILAVMFISGGHKTDGKGILHEKEEDTSENDSISSESSEDTAKDKSDNENKINAADGETAKDRKTGDKDDSDGEGSSAKSDATSDDSGENSTVADSSSAVPEPYAFTDDEWALLQHGAAYLILTLGGDSLKPGAAVSVSDMTQTQMNDLAYTYLNNMWDEALKNIFPTQGLVNNDGDPWYSYKKSVVQNVVKAVTGNDGYEPGNDNGVKCEADNILFAAADGAPLYVSRRYNVIKTGDHMTVDVEMAALANVSYWVEGLYRLNMMKDTSSSLGYVITSVEKLENPINTVTTSASSTLAEGNNTKKYQSANVIDHSMTTAWVEGASGNGIGEYVQLNFDREQSLHGIRIASGYMKSNTTYEENAAPTRIALDFSDGKHIEIDLTDSYRTYISGTEPACLSWGERAGMYGYDASKWDLAKDFMDTVSFGQEIKTSFVRITILEVKSGTKFTDTCISEILPY